MPAHSAPRPDLVSITALLNQLISQTNAGDWEAVTASQPEVCHQLAYLQRCCDDPTYIRNLPPVDRNKLNEISALINTAELACKTRRDHIAPLVNSLKALPFTIEE